MGFYQSKVIDYGYKEKVIVYDNKIVTGESIDTDTERQKYQDMDSAKNKYLTNVESDIIKKLLEILLKLLWWIVIWM